MRPSRKVKEFWDENNNRIVTEYCMTNCNKNFEGNDIIVYGMKVVTEKNSGEEREVFSIEDISSKEEFVEGLFNLFVEGNVTVTTAIDIIEDYII